MDKSVVWKDGKGRAEQTLEGGQCTVPRQVLTRMSPALLPLPNHLGNLGSLYLGTYLGT